MEKAGYDETAAWLKRFALYPGRVYAGLTTENNEAGDVGTSTRF